MPQRQKLFGSKSLVALALMPIVGVNLLASTVHAEDCLAAPNSPAREGTRWYYRLERTTQHKCWYMRPLNQPTQQVAAPTKTPLPAPAFAIPIPRPRPSATGSASSKSQGDPGPSSSYPEEIAAKASAVPPVSGSNSRHYIVNSKGIHFTASRYIVGRTNAKRCTPNRRGNGRNHFGDFRDASSSAIAVD